MKISIADAFDLPEWLGTHEVRWHAESSLLLSPSVPGVVAAGPELTQQLDLLAVDAAHPQPVCPEPQRSAAHQSWHYGEVALLDVDGRLAAAVPGTRFDANLACEALRRVAKAVGAPESNFTVAVTL